MGSTSYDLYADESTEEAYNKVSKAVAMGTSNQLNTSGFQLPSDQVLLLLMEHGPHDGAVEDSTGQRLGVQVYLWLFGYYLRTSYLKMNVL